MTHPIAPASPPALVPLRERHDGWTANRQWLFIQALTEGGSVTEAAALVGMSKASAYRLKHHPDSATFANAWRAATALAGEALVDELAERVRMGAAVAIVHAGEVVGTKRVMSDRLLMYAINRHDAQVREDGHDVARHVEPGALAKRGIVRSRQVVARFDELAALVEAANREQPDAALPMFEPGPTPQDPASA